MKRSSFLKRIAGTIAATVVGSKITLAEKVVEDKKPSFDWAEQPSKPLTQLRLRDIIVNKELLNKNGAQSEIVKTSKYVVVSTSPYRLAAKSLCGIYPTTIEIKNNEQHEWLVLAPTEPEN